MNMQNKQHVANLLAQMYGYNASTIALPGPDGLKNSTNDTGIYSDAWSDEFFAVRESSADNVISLKVDGAELYAYNFTLDSKPVHIVALEFDSVEPEGAALLNGHCEDAYNLVISWLGQSNLSDHNSNHVIFEFAKLADYDDKGATR